MRIVEVGQYLVTKDTGNLIQFSSVACREYTLPRDDPASQAKGWIQGNMSIGLVLEVTTSFKNFKYGIEIRIESVNQDNSEFEWNIFPGFTTLQICDKISDLLSNFGETPETYTGRILFMSMFNDISCDRKANKDERLANARVVKVLARNFGAG